MRRLFFIPHDCPSWLRSWEISPCREYYSTDGDSYVEVVDLSEEPHVDPDIGSELFYGVYMNLSEAAIARGAPPAFHVRDFDTRDEAFAFVRAITGMPVEEPLISGAGESK